MADLTRAEQLVQTMDRETAFREEVEAASTIAAKWEVLEARGFGDVTLEEMRTYVEIQGGTLTTVPIGRELSEQELASVAGGLTEAESIGVTVAIAAGVAASATAAVV